MLKRSQFSFKETMSSSNSFMWKRRGSNWKCLCDTTFEICQILLSEIHRPRNVASWNRWWTDFSYGLMILITSHQLKWYFLETPSLETNGRRLEDDQETLSLGIRHNMEDYRARSIRQMKGSEGGVLGDTACWNMSEYAESMESQLSWTRSWRWLTI